ncbi:hypothetical protein GCM10011360_17780 [Primorskyibacter flagellatus]|uniref:Uncharacterized protein n=2 Tax=Primorskyibacter flagellatus TaxID=1387277 RepID=A0A917A7D7_9RHOB|nr:hypothetical protein GCM10011360_17780 [Primorskyibacter flagellatus]
MWDRIVEVFAIYGALVLLFYVAASFTRSARNIRSDFFAILTGWTLMTFILGAIYVLMGLTIAY